MTRENYWKRKSVTQPVAILRIEGENVTYAEIAKRIGVSIDTARQRLGRLRGASGAVTWERLRAFGKAAA